MTDTDRLAGALRRLATAVDTLEAVATRRAQSDAARANLAEEFAVMEDDRSRLAVELDGALGRVRTLSVAHEEIGRRLEAVDDAVRSVLAHAGPRDGED